MAAVPGLYNSPFQYDVIITHHNDAKINSNELVTDDWTSEEQCVYVANCIITVSLWLVLNQ